MGKKQKKENHLTSGLTVTSLLLFSLRFHSEKSAQSL